MTAGGKTTTYGYVRNWLSSVTDAMGNTESYSLDWAGNVTTKYDRNGNTTDYTYDGLGRLKTSSAGGPTESRTYTQTGQLKEASNGILTIKYKYNEAGQLWKEEDFLPGAGSAQTTKTYTYDANGNRTKLETTGTGGLTQSYVYDRMNRMTDMYENGTFAGVPAVSYKYDHAGNRETMTYNKGTANEVVESYTYNGLNQVKKLENKRNGTYLSKYEYEYQHDGAQYEKKETKYNASGVQADVITTTYAYDGMGRLKGESDGVTAKTYKYEDDKGAYKTNRLKMTVSGADNYIVNYSYDGNNRLTEERRVESAATYISSYCYDNNGNQTAKLKAVEAVSSGPAGLSLTEAGTGWELYEYDEFNRLTEALVEGVTTKYTYRPDGLRNSKASGSTTTTFLWDGWNMIAENKGGTIKTYLYGINLVKNDSSYYLYNAHGDVVHLTDGSGLVTWNYDYDAFGNERNPDPNDTNPFRYCGQYWDAETETIYLRARNYSPKLGRFTQQDGWGYANPADPLSLNLYTYCANNPVRFSDPSGLAPVNIEEYAQAMGATTSIYQKDGKDHITVTYNGVSQNYTYFNSKKIDDSVLNTRFGWENSWIPNGQLQAVYTGVHSVMLGNYHSSVIIFAAPGSQYYDTDNFKDNIYDGGHVQYATLGAGSVGGKLISGVNRKPNDINMDIKVQMISMGVYDVYTIDKLFAYELYYRTYCKDVNYDLFPNPNKTTGGYGKGYNSNSFAAGILKAAGITPITPSYNVPGFDKPLPTSYFRRTGR